MPTWETAYVFPPQGAVAYFGAAAADSHPNGESPQKKTCLLKIKNRSKEDAAASNMRALPAGAALQNYDRKKTFSKKGPLRQRKRTKKYICIYTYRQIEN